MGTTSNQYNGDGTLVAQTQNSLTTRAVHDLIAPLSQILADGTHRSIYGTPAERLSAQQGSSTTWYRVDTLNSVRALLGDAIEGLGQRVWGLGIQRPALHCSTSQTPIPRP